MERKVANIFSIAVGACAAAGKMPPPGWPAPDESVRSVGVSEVYGESKFPQK